MVVATKPSRDQIARMAGNDPQLIRAIEALFDIGAADSPTEVDALRNAVEGLEVAPLPVPVVQDDGADLLPPIVPFRDRPYGMFSANTTQSPAVVNTAYPITFTTAAMARGCYAVLPDSKIYVNAGGVYDVQISMQFDSTSGGSHAAWVWFRVNGNDVPNSASLVRIQGNNAELFTGLNMFLSLAAGDYVEIAWAASDTNIQLLAGVASGVVPAIPSIILTISSHVGGEQ
jgi:hypothetical protein